jgi:hypothetical protein
VEISKDCSPRNGVAENVPKSIPVQSQRARYEKNRYHIQMLGMMLKLKLEMYEGWKKISHDSKSRFSQ